MKLEVFPDRDALMHAAAARLAKSLERAIAARGSACAALSGGATPEPAYAHLAAMALDWPRVTFLLVDERFVPPSDPASNEAMLRRALAPALAAGAQLMPLYTPGLSHQHAANQADAAYAPLAIDVALMGMGADAHTASWFPRASRLAEALHSSRTVIALNAPQAAGSTARLTLTRAAIAHAERVLLLIQGEDKRAVLEAALSQAPEDAPVAALFDDPSKAPEALWAA